MQALSNRQHKALLAVLADALISARASVSAGSRRGLAPEECAKLNELFNIPLNATTISRYTRHDGIERHPSYPFRAASSRACDGAVVRGPLPPAGMARLFQSMLVWFRALLGEAEELERQGVWPPPSNGLADGDVIEGIRSIFPAGQAASNRYSVASALSRAPKV